MAERFLWQRSDVFEIQGYYARCEYKTESSIGFHLGHSAWEVGGFLDVHFPCQGHIKVAIRVCHARDPLPDFHPIEFANHVLFAMGIPSDETFEAWFQLGTQCCRAENATNRDGETDRFYGPSCEVAE